MLHSLVFIIFRNILTCHGVNIFLRHQLGFFVNPFAPKQSSRSRRKSRLFRFRRRLGNDSHVTSGMAEKRIPGSVPGESERRRPDGFRPDKFWQFVQLKTLFWKSWSFKSDIANFILEFFKQFFKKHYYCSTST
jgi:hypothetical protein